MSAARASSKASTCLQTLSVLRLGRKVRSLLVAPVVASWFADVSCIGRNVIIEQSYGGPKITKGEPLFLFPTLYILSFCSFPFAISDCMRVPSPASYSFFVALYCDIVLISHVHLDGVTVAKAITLKDKFENLGARYGPLFSCDAYIDFLADWCRTLHKKQTRLPVMARPRQQFSRALSMLRVLRTLLLAVTLWTFVAGARLQ